MGGEIADEKVRQRLSRIPDILVLGLERGTCPLVLVSLVPDDLPILVDGHAIHFIGGAFRVLRLRRFLLDTHEATLDAGCAVMVEDDEHPATRDLVDVIGVALGVDPFDLGFKLR